MDEKVNNVDFGNDTRRKNNENWPFYSVESWKQRLRARKQTVTKEPRHKNETDENVDHNFLSLSLSISMSVFM